MRNRLGSVVWFLVVTLVLCEVAARFMFPIPEILNFNRVQFTPLWLFGGLDEVAKTGGSPSDVFSYQPQKPLRNVQIEWISEPDGVAAAVTLNLFGFRGSDFRIEKTPGTARVLFFGDSYAEGIGAEDHESIPAVFQQVLPKHSLEVINLGIAGIDLPMLSRLATVTIPLLKPDHVVVLVYQNDLPSVPLVKDQLPTQWNPFYSNPLVPRLVQTALDLIDDHTPALRYHRGPFPFFRSTPHPSNPLTVSEETFQHLPPHLIEAMRAGHLNPYLPYYALHLEQRLLISLDDRTNGRTQMADLRNLSERVGASLLVGFIPVSISVSDHYRIYWQELGADFSRPSLTTPEFAQQQVALGDVLRNLSIPFVDTTPMIREAEAGGKRLYTNYDTHLTPEGYDFVARAIANRFERDQYR